MECGKHDILPVAGAIQDHAQLPVTMPRESDSSMCLDGSTTAQTVPSPPSMSPEECTARPDSYPRTRIDPKSVEDRVYSCVGVHWRPPERGRRSCPRRKRGARLRGQDKSREVRAGWGSRLRVFSAPLASALHGSLAGRADQGQGVPRLECPLRLDSSRGVRAIAWFGVGQSAVALSRAATPSRTRWALRAHP